MITFGITNVCSGYSLVIGLGVGQKKKKKRHQVQNLHPVDKTRLRRHFSVEDPGLPTPAVNARSLPRDGHPRGSGTLAATGWSCLETSSSGGTAGLARGAEASGEALVGDGGDLLAEVDWRY